MIEIREVTKRYGNFTAVDRLSLEVPAGELFAFLGPNGAGKTTTIKMIAGLLLPDAGSVHLCGYPMGRDGRQAKAQLAYVPDEPFLYEKLSGREFLDFVAEMYGLTPEAKQRRLDDLIDRLEMGTFLDKLCEGYSHGMKQRTVLAAAMLHEPRVLVIDEPMVGLDPKTVRTVKDLMGEMTRRGGTVFMSTHTLEIAEAMADRIGIIHHGKLVAVGTVDELKANADRDTTLEDIFLGLTDEEGDARPFGPAAKRDQPEHETGS
ncbi:MAG: ABC transporter ATP-binding protein [Planctomycetes bacterium]|nr:ABC transporter ATP-binding protein [Planctomycetota bacterium]